ncbi:hypothetical protein SAMN05421679_106134 [Epilithonimonas pallida]|uniref:Uncharacterized protein n=2 Tax=Epilithonimonas pallida TaxID=373671 RepID=A0ABY1R4H3_9FLAO|nr:hypothetical protein SAMN05421679_106134 [Epilithonimonas pallida]
MPIMAYHSFTPQTTNLYNFKKFKEAGFNINYTVFKTNEQLQLALDLAQKANIKILAYSDELITNTENTVLRFRNHPALYGYFIADEPSSKDFNRVKNLIELIKKLDSKHIVYTNLFPNYATKSLLGDLDYEDYVSLFLKQVNADLLSFDFYPIVNNQIRKSWYQNLEIIKNISQEFNKPFWAYACSTIHYDYKKPTLGGLKLQQFSNLLYGAKGLEYFTYITMDDEYWKKHNYSYSIVYNNGKPTPTYSLVKAVNEQVKRLSWVFLQSKVDSVFHIGDSIPIGTKRMNFLPKKFKKFKTFEKRALVSFMSGKNGRFVIIQNKDMFRSMPFNYQVTTGVSIIDNNTGKINKTTSKEIINNIPPGDILIFNYQ